MHLHSGDVGAASITADGESYRGKEIHQRESAALLSGLCTGSLAKENRLGSKIAITPIARVLLAGGGVTQSGGASSGAGWHFKSQSCAETHQELGLAS